MADRPVDIVNDTILLARELGYQQVRYALAQVPNQAGVVRGDTMLGRVKMDDLRRLAKGG